MRKFLTLLRKESGVWDSPPETNGRVASYDGYDPWEPRPRRKLRAYLRLLRYAVPRWRGLGVVLLSMAVLIGLELAKPWPMKILVDHVLKKNRNWDEVGGFIDWLPGAVTRHSLLFWVVAGTILIFLAAMLISIIYSIASVSVGQRMTYDLGSDLFLHMQRMSLLFHVRRPVGDSIARVTGDPYCVQMLVNGALLPLIQSVVTVVAMFYVMWRLDPQMTLLSMAVVPFIVYTIHRFKDPMKEQSRIRADLEGSLMSVVQQSLTSIPLIQAFNKEETEHRRFRSYADRTVSAHVNATFVDMGFKLFAGLATAGGTAAMIWIGAGAVLDGSMTLGTLLVFLAYLGALYGPIDQMTYTASTFQHALAQADRVLDIIDQPIDVVESPDAVHLDVKGQVVYENVCFGYDPDKPVLKDICFEADPGQVTAIVGPTGAGKSTLVNLLIRFFAPQQGRILIDGHDIRDIKLNSLRDQIAIVLQEPFIFPISIAENIAYGRPDATMQEIEAAAQAANASDFILRLPEVYATVVGERGATLSGGEKQRLSIARAFLKDAPILIMDEPTSALDALTEVALLDAMRRLMEGRVTFVIAHRLSTIRNADQILVLNEGEIIERGNHRRLLRTNGLYAQMYRQQMNIAQHRRTASAVVVPHEPPRPVRTRTKKTSGT